MSRPRYLIPFVFLVLVIAITQFSNVSETTSINKGGAYEVLSNADDAKISDGKLDLTSGGYLRIKDIDGFVKGDFLIRLKLYYLTKRGLLIKFTDVNTLGSGLNVERNDFHFSNVDFYNIEISRKGDNYFISANGLILSAWEEQNRILGDLLIDAMKSDVYIDSIEIIDLSSTKPKTVWRDSFSRFNLGSFKFIPFLIAAFVLFIFIHAIESKVLSKLLHIPHSKQPGTLLGSMAIMAFILILGRLIPAFGWIGLLSFPAILYMRIRFFLINSNVLNIEKETGKKWRVFFFISLALSTVTLFWVVFSALKDRGNFLDPVFAGFTFLTIFGMLIPLLSLRLARSVNLKRAYEIFGFSSFLLAIIGLILLILPKSEELLMLITLLFPAAILVYCLPIRANSKRIAGYNLIMMFVALLFFISIEAAMRISPYAARFHAMNIGNSFEEDDLLFWAPKGFFPHGADFSYRDDMTVRTINFRSGAVPKSKPKNVYRIMVLGGSNVYGDGIDNPRETFSQVLEKMANANLEKTRIEVINAGVPGYNSFQIKIFFKYFASKYNPDLVICYLGRNDVTSGVGIYSLKEIWDMAHSSKGKTVKKLQKILSKSALYNGLTQSIVSLRNKSIPKRFTKDLLKPVIPLGDFEANLTEIVEVAQGEGAKVIFASEYWGEPILKQAEFHVVDDLFTGMSQAAKRNNVPYVDIYKIMAEQFELFDIVFGHDVVHLNHNGHKELAKIFYEILVRQGLLPVTDTGDSQSN